MEKAKRQLSFNQKLGNGTEDLNGILEDQCVSKDISGLGLEGEFIAVAELKCK